MSLQSLPSDDLVLPEGADLNQLGCVVGQYLEQQFAGSRGMIALQGQIQGQSERQFHWGEQVTCDAELHRRNCRISNLAARDMTLVNEGPMLCPRTKYPHFCQPIITSGQLVGIIHVGFGSPFADSGDEGIAKHILANVSENISSYLGAN